MPTSAEAAELPLAAVVGISVAATAAVCLLLAVIVICCLRRRWRRQPRKGAAANGISNVAFQEEGHGQAPLAGSSGHGGGYRLQQTDERGAATTQKQRQKQKQTPGPDDVTKISVSARSPDDLRFKICRLDGHICVATDPAHSSKCSKYGVRSGDRILGVYIDFQSAGADAHPRDVSDILGLVNDFNTRIDFEHRGPVAKASPSPADQQQQQHQQQRSAGRWKQFRGVDVADAPTTRRAKPRAPQPPEDRGSTFTIKDRRRRHHLQPQQEATVERLLAAEANDDDWLWVEARLQLLEAEEAAPGGSRAASTGSSLAVGRSCQLIHVTDPRADELLADCCFQEADDSEWLWVEARLRLLEAEEATPGSLAAAADPRVDQLLLQEADDSEWLWIGASLLVREESDAHLYSTVSDRPAAAAVSLNLAASDDERSAAKTWRSLPASNLQPEEEEEEEEDDDGSVLTPVSHLAASSGYGSSRPPTNLDEKFTRELPPVVRVYDRYELDEQDCVTPQPAPEAAKPTRTSWTQYNAGEASPTDAMGMWPQWETLANRCCRPDAAWVSLPNDDSWRSARRELPERRRRQLPTVGDEATAAKCRVSAAAAMQQQHRQHQQHQQHQHQQQHRQQQHHTAVEVSERRLQLSVASSGAVGQQKQTSSAAAAAAAAQPPASAGSSRSSSRASTVLEEPMLEKKRETEELSPGRRRLQRDPSLVELSRSMALRDVEVATVLLLDAEAREAAKRPPPSPSPPPAEEAEVVAKDRCVEEETAPAFGDSSGSGSPLLDAELIEEIEAGARGVWDNDGDDGGDGISLDESEAELSDSFQEMLRDDRALSGDGLDELIHQREMDDELEESSV